MYNILIVVCCLAVSAAMVRRVLVWRRKPEHKHFSIFWLWPSAWFVTMNFIPRFACDLRLFTTMQILLLGGMLLDFGFYYVFRSEDKRQLWSGLWLIPCALVIFRHNLLPAEPLVVPHSDRALIWTEGVLFPSTFYFMHPNTRAGAAQNDDYDDPNYGEAVFSPLEGEIESLADPRFPVLRTDSGVRVRIGPIIEGSYRLREGARIVNDQPMGLRDTVDEGPRGLRLDVLSGRVVFRDVVAGRMLGLRHNRMLLKRNQVTLSDSPTRFKVNPKSR